MDIILAFPSLLLALVLVAVLGPGLTNAMIAISLCQPAAFRPADARFGHFGAEKEYVIASRVAGAGTFRLMFKTILPNCLAPLIVQATSPSRRRFSMLPPSAFSAMGAQPPTPEWGTMLADPVSSSRAPGGW